MTYTDAAGNTFTKTFVFKRGDYAVNVNYSVQNTGENRWKYHLWSDSQNNPSTCLLIATPAVATLRCIRSAAQRTPAG